MALRILAALAALVLVVVLGGLGLLVAKRPRSRPASGEKIAVTPERAARGRYLAEHVSDCVGCHSERDATRYGLPLKPGTEGSVGFAWDPSIGFPGRVTARNITSDLETGIGAWSDGEVLRAFREGIDRQGKAIFPLMPYRYYHEMRDEDARAVVAYLRTLPPVKKSAPPRELRFPVNFFVKWAPLPVERPVPLPDPAEDRLAHGKYLVAIAGCRECHTPHDAHGTLLEEKGFQGGFEMLGPWGRVVTANITPNHRVYMGQATRSEFVGRFKAFASIASMETAPIAKPGRNTVMPWLAYAGMTEDDLGAIFDYLKTLPPAGGPVESFPDSPAAPLPPGAPVIPERPGA
jgi:mono/diheme cytochrome c family protein